MYNTICFLGNEIPRWQKSTRGKSSERVKEKNGKLKGGQIGIMENNSHNQMLWTGKCVMTPPQPQSIGWN